MTEHSGFDLFVHLVKNSLGVTYLLALFHNTFDERQSELFDHIFHNFFLKHALDPLMPRVESFPSH